MEPYRILHFVNVLDRGGTESFLFNNLAEMDRTAVQFDFLCTRDQVEAYEAELQQLGCRKIVVTPDEGGLVRRYLSLHKKLYAYFQTCGYEVIHFQSNPPGIFSTASVVAAYRAKIPVRVLHSHGAGGEQLSFGALRPVITKVCRKIQTHCCTDFMAPSRLAAEYAFGKKIAAKKCRYIMNGVNAKRFSFSAEGRETIRRELQLEGCTVLGTVARFSEVKNHLLMVRILAQYRKADPTAKLLLVGGEIQSEPGVKDAVQQLAESLGVAEYLVFVDQTTRVRDYLSAMDVFLTTSRTEALSIASIEAQINGLPVVAAADGIPKDMDVTGNVHWCHLAAPLSAWAAAVQAAKRRPVDLNSAGIRRADVRKTAEELTAFYLQKQKNRRRTV